MLVQSGVETRGGVGLLVKLEENMSARLLFVGTRGIFHWFVCLFFKQNISLAFEFQTKGDISFFSSNFYGSLLPTFSRTA